jgi:cobalt-zinc-cadmium resistance protein CzcA
MSAAATSTFDEQYPRPRTGTRGSVEDIENIVLTSLDGVPTRIRDVAMVGLGQELRTGAATVGGEESVIGTTIMLLGENSRAVARRVAQKMSEVNRTLPAGVQARTLYDRTHLVDATLHTVRKNLVEGALLVIVILFLLLGNLRGAIIVAAAIPLSMLFAVSGMVERKISGNLMSLGAIDFGIIVDGAVVMVENIIRRFAHRQQALGRLLTRNERLDEAFESAREVARPTLFGVGIIMVVYLPILSLSGIEGKMFRPMASVVLLALSGALLLFTFVPAAIAPAVRPGRRAPGPVRAPPNRRTSRFCVAPPAPYRGGFPAVASGSRVRPDRVAQGSEFIPKLGEGARHRDAPP